jgi:hypothetical protein
MWPNGDGQRYFRNTTQFLVGERSEPRFTPLPIFAGNSLLLRPARDVKVICSVLP